MKKEFKHIMLDIETMGSVSNSCIVSIGAVKFDLDSGETGDEFYVNIDLQSCLDMGLVVNGSTINWWMSQDDSARKKLTDEESVDLMTALHKFSKFCSYDHEIWGNSARFDCGILQDAYNKFNDGPIPWDFRKERCVRTLVSFNPEIKKNTVFVGTKHDALADCKHQIKYCSEIWKTLKNK